MIHTNCHHHKKYILGGMFMNIIDQAILTATTYHEGQYRKGSDTPYITHPFSVGMILQAEQCTDEVIAAGILHDTLEDTELSYEALVELFGLRIAELVLAASEEDKTLTWTERKQQTIDALPLLDTDSIQIIVADKLHNLRSIRRDLKTHGEQIWNRFNKGEKEQCWYYDSIVKSLLPRKHECRLIEKLEMEVHKVFKR